MVPAEAAIPVPAEVPNEVAAQLLIKYVTARMVLRGLRKSLPDESLRGAVLVTATSAVVARLLLHFLDQEGSSAIGLARVRLVRSASRSN